MQATTATLVKRIVRTPDICGGQARIEGHRIRVRDIVNWFERLRMSADEIAYQYELELADIYLALAYYYANFAALQEEWAADDRFVETMKRKHPSRLKQYCSNG